MTLRKKTRDCGKEPLMKMRLVDFWRVRGKRIGPCEEGNIYSLARVNVRERTGENLLVNSNTK